MGWHQQYSNHSDKPRNHPEDQRYDEPEEGFRERKLEGVTTLGKAYKQGIEAERK